MSLILSGTDGLSDVDGTAAAPALRGTDTNTGIFFPAADTIAFAEGGAEAMRINSSGFVGIGTTTPSQLVTVGNTTATRGQVYVQSPSGSSPTVTLDNAATASGHSYTLYSGAPNAGDFAIYDATAAAYRAIIDSSGNLLVGTTSSSNMNGIGSKQTDAGNQCFSAWNSATSGTRYLAYFGTGSTYTNVGAITSNGTSTSYVTSSDYRLKNTVVPMTGALNRIAALKPVTYKWNADNSDSEGFIAHELAEVCPQAVIGEKDAVETYMDEDGVEQTRPKYQGIDTSFLVATLTAAIQELKAIVDTQAARITALEAANV
jgi:hypothetical protein